jgi:hypothetical protein
MGFRKTCTLGNSLGDLLLSYRYDVCYTGRMPTTPKPDPDTDHDEAVTFRPGSLRLAHMRWLHGHVGIPVSEQIRRALDAWLPTQAQKPPAPTPVRKTKKKGKR